MKLSFVRYSKTEIGIRMLESLSFQHSSSYWAKPSYDPPLSGTHFQSARPTMITNKKVSGEESGVASTALINLPKFSPIIRFPEKI